MSVQLKCAKLLQMQTNIDKFLIAVSVYEYVKIIL